MVADAPAHIVEEFTVTVGNGLTVTIIVTGSPTQPDELVSITFKVAVPVLVQVTVIRLGVAPGIIVPLPPANGVTLHA
jgi:hypothetical protein